MGRRRSKKSPPPQGSTLVTPANGIPLMLPPLTFGNFLPSRYSIPEENETSSFEEEVVLQTMKEEEKVMRWLQFTNASKTVLDREPATTIAPNNRESTLIGYIIGDQQGAKAMDANVNRVWSTMAKPKRPKFCNEFLVYGHVDEECWYQRKKDVDTDGRKDTTGRRNMNLKAKSVHRVWVPWQQEIVGTGLERSQVDVDQD
ncbi:hypothetical protein HAX54_009022 [Datura stramonium]|uniref:Uncharacterized protein n=1 Tax=Datura stramonium TaxID=4076 RepID=A0ABS8TE90_DATST|nr:hypothetical protein [Datura stramonium]